MVEKIAERFDKARIITKARVKDLIITDGACTGCIYEKGGVDFKEFGPVIFASGGFGADFARNSLLATYRSRWARLSVQKSSDLEWVQVHTTGLVKPDDPDGKIKFFAVEGGTA